MAICAAFNSPEVEIVGLTTIFGNVLTPTATTNAFILLKLVGEGQVCLYSMSTGLLQGEAPSLSMPTSLLTTGDHVNAVLHACQYGDALLAQPLVVLVSGTVHEFLSLV